MPLPGHRHLRSRADHQSRPPRPLTRWQRQVADLPGVQAVIGPGTGDPPGRAVAKDRQRLARLGRESRAAVNQLGKLGRSLNVAAGGVSAAPGRDLAGDLRGRPALRWLRPGRKRGAHDLAWPRRRRPPAARRQSLRSTNCQRAQKNWQMVRRRRPRRRCAEVWHQDLPAELSRQRSAALAAMQKALNETHTTKFPRLIGRPKLPTKS